MNFSIEELNSKLFYAETNMQSVQHPHIYLQWMQIKLTEKLLNEMKHFNMAVKQQGNG